VAAGEKTSSQKMKRAGVVFADRSDRNASSGSLLPNQQQERQLMKKLIAALFALMLCSASHAPGQITVNTYDDIQFWAGLGANRSALVVEFNSDSDSFSVAWGYRWSGVVSLQTMMFDLAGVIFGGPAPVSGSDPRLSVSVSSFGSMGYFIDTLTYDQSGLGGAWPSGTLSLTGWDGTNWNNLFTLNDGSPVWMSRPFDLSNVGMAGITLVNGGWYGLVMADGPDTYNFRQPVSAVPEPTTSALALIGVAAVLLKLYLRTFSGKRHRFNAFFRHE
jgi:hypothetical protein